MSDPSIKDKLQLLCLVIAMGMAIGFIVFLTTAFEQKRPCSDYANGTIKNIPVRCLSYYGITGEK